MAKVLEKNGQDYVAVNSHYIDPKTMVLNHGETFGIFDRQGDILNIGNKHQGIFYKNSRYLSKLDFSINGHRPNLLSSAIREFNEGLSICLTNPIIHLQGQEFKEQSLFIKRLKILSEAYYEEFFSFKSYADQDVVLDIEIEIDADFKDIFELRGFQRKSPLEPSQIDFDGERIKIHYLGRDHVRRQSEITCIPKQFDYNDHKISVTIPLSAKSSNGFKLTIKFCYLEDRNLTSCPEENVTSQLQQGQHTLPFRHELPNFTSDNQHFDHLLYRAKVDFQTLLGQFGNQIYPMAGVPWFNTPFGRDGIIFGIQTLAFAPWISKSILYFLASKQADAVDHKSEAEPGKIIHEIRSGELANIGDIPFRKYYGAADSTPLFLWLAGLYFERTCDYATLNQIWPSLKMALLWIREYGDSDGDGFVEYEKKNPQGLDNQCWKDSIDSIMHHDGQLAQAPIAVCEIQGYLYQAYRYAAQLTSLFNEHEHAKELSKKADQLKSQFNEIFWDEKLNYFAIALDRDKRRCGVFSSNPGHTLATEIIHPEKAEAVAARLLSPELFSGWGIRTLGTKECRYNPMSYHNGSIWPHDNSLIIWGLKKYGFHDQALSLVKSLFDASLSFELQRLPELFCGLDREANEGPIIFPVACTPQAWSVGAVFLMIQSILGIHIDAYRRIIRCNQPLLPDFLNTLHIENIYLDEKSRLGIKFLRFNTDVGLEITQRPSGWRIISEK